MSSSLLKILTSEIWQSTPNDPKLNPNNLTRKVLYIWSSTYGVPRAASPTVFHSFHSTASHFQDIPHVMIPIDSYVKFQTFLLVNF